jgi:hypothetical protein
MSSMQVLGPFQYIWRFQANWIKKPFKNKINLVNLICILFLKNAIFKNE